MPPYSLFSERWLMKWFYILTAYSKAFFNEDEEKCTKQLFIFSFDINLAINASTCAVIFLLPQVFFLFRLHHLYCYLYAWWTAWKASQSTFSTDFVLFCINKNFPKDIQLFFRINWTFYIFLLRYTCTLFNIFLVVAVIFHEK